MKIKKSLKPIDYDIHLKYLCPNPSCCCQHWLSFKEASAKNFRVVCECGQIFKVKRLQKFNVEYCEKVIPAPVVETNTVENTLDRQIPGSFENENKETDIKSESVSLLKKYGFTETEANVLIEKTLAENPDIDDHVKLVKHSLFWIKNE
jgi:hypothetical protein